MVDESWLWHKRLGNLCFDNLSKISMKEAARYLPKIVVPLNSVCRHCQHGNKLESVLK